MQCNERAKTILPHVFCINIFIYICVKKKKKKIICNNDQAFIQGEHFFGIKQGQQLRPQFQVQHAMQCLQI